MFLQNSEEPIEQFLARSIGDAQREISTIPANAVGKDVQNLVNHYIDKYIIKIVELDKAVAKLDPDKPLTATVTWAIKGNTSIIGLADSKGQSVDLKKNSQTKLTQALNYPGPIAGNEQLQSEIKQRIASITTGIAEHFKSLNAAVAEHNLELRTAIPEFINERARIVNRTRSAEDFLNS